MEVYDWKCKPVNELTQTEKDELLQKIFQMACDNEYYDDMGSDIFDELKKREIIKRQLIEL